MAVFDLILAISNSAPLPISKCLYTSRQKTLWKLPQNIAIWILYIALPQILLYSIFSNYTNWNSSSTLLHKWLLKVIIMTLKTTVLIKNIPSASTPNKETHYYHNTEYYVFNLVVCYCIYNTTQLHYMENCLKIK